MKRLYFVTMFIWAVVGNLSAQTDSIPLGSLNSIAGQLTRQSVTSTLFPLADGLMLAQSFDEVARQLTRNGFTKVEVDDGVLTAESSLCDLRAVNRSGRAAQIDTLTLFVKRSLNRDILKDSLQRASYTFIETSADQRYVFILSIRILTRVPCSLPVHNASCIFLRLRCQSIVAHCQ